jgi:divalent metal cation (Fe/Co/Zn/Cd) transporter
MHHHPAIEAVDTVLAYQVGSRLQAEVDIVLPPGMPLRAAHDIGESLQRRLEGLPGVERAFVHLDTETAHGRDQDSRHSCSLSRQKRQQRMASCWGRHTLSRRRRRTSTLL